MALGSFHPSQNALPKWKWSQEEKVCEAAWFCFLFLKVFLILDEQVWLLERFIMNLTQRFKGNRKTRIGGGLGVFRIVVGKARERGISSLIAERHEKR